MTQTKANRTSVSGQPIKSFARRFQPLRTKDSQSQQSNAKCSCDDGVPETHQKNGKGTSFNQQLLLRSSLHISTSYAESPTTTTATTAASC